MRETTIIWPYLEGGTYEFFHVPCPHCDHAAAGLEEPALGQGTPSHAYYVCKRTSVKDNGLRRRDRREKYKHEMLAGRWVATNPEGEYPSFHLNALYSPFAKSSWGVLASEWDRAQGKPADLQVFVNTRLAELWEDTKGVTDPNALFARVDDRWPRCRAARRRGAHRRRRRPGEPPRGVCLGVGRRLESWLVAHFIIPGDPEREPDQPGSVWAPARRVSLQVFPHEDSGGVEFVPITTTFVDSGFAATQVYRYTNARKGRNIFASKGVGGDGVSICSGRPRCRGARRPSCIQSGRQRRRMNSSDRNSEQQHGPGYVHLGDWVTEDQCKQLVAEKRKRKLRRPGRVVYTG
jgi:phage terminase large subunit GpA-like protein